MLYLWKFSLVRELVRYHWVIEYHTFVNQGIKAVFINHGNKYNYYYRKTYKVTTIVMVTSSNWQIA